jgi:uncharacterized protein (DUF885 family)
VVAASDYLARGMNKSAMSARALVIAMAFVLAACSAPVRRQDSSAAAELDATLDDITAEIIAELPELATGLGLDPAQAGYKFSDRLSDYSAAATERRAALMRNGAAALAAIDRAALSPADAVTLDVVAAALKDAGESDTFGYGTYGFGPPQPYVVTQLDGAYTTVPNFLDSQHEIASVADAEDYLARLTAYARVLDQETARIEADAADGIAPPDFVIDGALEQLTAFAAEAPADTVLVESLRRRLPEVTSLDLPTQAAIVARATAVVRDETLPAYRRQIEALTRLRPRASHEPGVWRLPDGDRLYAMALKQWTTTDLTPDQAHALGQRLVADLDGQMDALLTAQGLTEGTLAARLQSLGRRADQLYPNTDAGKAELIADLNAEIAALDPLLPRYFGVQAAAKLEVRRVPAYIEAGAPAGYYQGPSLDGSRPGVYYINLRDTAEVPRFTLPTLTYHEGVPGHHLAISVAQQATTLPLLRSAILDFPAFSEGWALYAEQLADEMGVYANDPWGRIGYLQSMAFRAARLVVDTGMHAKHWSRDQAIDYMVETTGMERSAVVTEIDRYAVWPGQACAYMLGRQVIDELREEARSRLGAAFDIRAFHDVILTSGSMPLSTLQTLVRAWIDDEQSGAR